MRARPMRERGMQMPENVVKKSRILTQLALEFMKIGLFTFGGGYAMIAMIENSCVNKRKWITHDEMMDITVIAESTPGPIAINCATYVGFRQAGFEGALAATLGIVLPSFAVIYAIAMLFDDFLSLTAAANAFRGIKVAVGILIIDAAVTMFKNMKKKAQPKITAALAFAVMLLSEIFSLGLSSVMLMALAGVVSLGLFMLRDGKKAGHK